MKKEDRVENGCLFKWCPRLGLWCSPHNDRTRTREVLVVPPEDGETVWTVVVPSTDTSNALQGDNVEGRAFAIAEPYTRQTDC